MVYLGSFSTKSQCLQRLSSNLDKFEIKPIMHVLTRLGVDRVKPWNSMNNVITYVKITAHGSRVSCIIIYVQILVLEVEPNFVFYPVGL